MTEAEQLQNLRDLARRIATLGHVTTVREDQPEKGRPLPEHILEITRKVWPQLSAEDQQTLSEWKRLKGI